jgi:hypothetical protein
MDTLGEALKEALSWAEAHQDVYGSPTTIGLYLDRTGHSYAAAAWPRGDAHSSAPCASPLEALTSLIELSQVLNPLYTVSKETLMLTAKIEKGNLVITIPMNAHPTPSASGKTLVVASSHGNQKSDLVIDGKNVVIGVNAYVTAK